MFAPASCHDVPLFIEVSSTPPSNRFSKSKRCQKVSVGEIAPDGMEIAVVCVSCWSETSDTLGENADRVPPKAAVVTEAQPQPPGTHVGTTDANVLSVPLSKVSLSGVVGVQVDVAVAVLVDVAVMSATAESYMPSDVTSERPVLALAPP